MNRLVAIMAAAGLMAAAPLLAADAAPKVDEAKLAACFGCHGADGNAPAPAFPKLAGQYPEYLAKQMADFKSGARKGTVMPGMVAILATPEEVKGAAAFFAAKAPNAGASADAAKAAKGARLYRGGNIASGVAACSACHGPAGAGIPAQYPRLAGQHAMYVTGELKKFRSGERANDPNNMMQAIAKKMSDEEIDAVAEYIAGLK